MQGIIIIGTQSKGRTTLAILKANNLTVYGFLDEDLSREGDQIDNIAILGSQEDPTFLGMLREQCTAFVALEEHVVVGREVQIEVVAQKVCLVRIKKLYLPLNNF